MSPRPLAGPDAILLDYLMQVVTIADRRNLGTQADVWRIADTHLHPGRQRARTRPRAQAREYAKALQRAETAERLLREARAQTPAPADEEPARTVHLTPRCASVITEAAAGRTRPEIAAELDTNVHAVNATLARAAKDIGAASPAHAVVLVASGRVQVQVRDQKRKGAA